MIEIRKKSELTRLKPDHLNSKGHISRTLKIALTAIVLILFSKLASAQTAISGEITSDRILSPSGNPFFVDKDIIIDPGVILTIEPGVLMRFQYNTKLICFGTLIAQGTPENQINFYPINPGTSSVLWYGIIFDNAITYMDKDGNYVSGSILSNVTINKAYAAVTLAKGTSMLLERVTIPQSSLGIYIEESSHNIIRNCTISQSDNSGIYLANGFRNHNNVITGNQISGSKDIGICISNDGSHSQNNLISGNTIQQCVTGVQMGNENYHGAGHNKLVNNHIYNNTMAVKLYQDSTLVASNILNRNGDGILLSGSGNDSIINNFIFENSQEAITITSGSSHNVIILNTIAYNKTGIWLKADPGLKSVNNIFLNNTVQNQFVQSLAIEEAPQQPIQGNNILDQPLFQSFNHSSSADLSASQNFWGVNTNAAIDSIIYDKQDQTGRGFVTYLPFLKVPAINAPIPAPSHVRKQQIGNDIIVSWNNVNSADLDNYSVSYGKNDGITYANRVINGKQLFRNMGSFPIMDTIALTALRVKADGKDDQVEGNESSYVYATLAPYAGPDTAICKNSSYEIINSTAIASESLLWTTTGDGHFSEPNQLNPIYFPGENDYLSGEVFLILSAKTADQQVNDAAHIKFYDPSIAYAGADTIISIDTTLQLAGARASNFNKLEWKTSGDGTFDQNNILKPVYTPGNSDTAAGNVKLWITAYSICGSVTDTLQVIIDRGFSMTGTVKAGFSPAAGSTLELYMNNAKSKTLMRKASVAADGSFRFNAVLEGEYYLYVIPGSGQEDKYLPTYFFTSIFWEQAPRVIVKGETGDVDVELQPIYNLPAGQGSISGFCRNDNGSCGDVSVLLYDKLRKYVFRWTRSSGAGLFSFADLPYGTYVLAGVKTGTPVFYSQQIVISPASPDVSQIELQCTSAIFKFSVPAIYLKQDTDTDGDFTMYPNPCRERLSIVYTGDQPATRVRLINSQGVVYNFLIANDNKTENIIDLNAVPAGLYIVEVCTDEVCLVRKKLVKL